MAPVDLHDPASFAGALAYEHADIPPGQTIADWRRERSQQARAAHAARRGARRQRLRALISLRQHRAVRRVGASRPVGASR